MPGFHVPKVFMVLLEKKKKKKQHDLQLLGPQVGPYISQGYGLTLSPLCPPRRIVILLCDPSGS